MAIVCHCLAIRESTIVKSIRRGASSVDDIRATCGATTRCGGCELAIDELLHRQGRCRDLVGSSSFASNPT